jgi:NADPH:quinone reductase-like Zn-dependent oxidoreductase
VDAAGEVVALGPAVQGFALGDHVCCAAPPNRPGSYGGFVTVDSRLVGRVRSGMGFAAAAALPCAGLTAWEALFERLRIHDESSLLVLGGAGGVGSMAVQLARLQTQAVVTATAFCNFCHDFLNFIKELTPLSLRNLSYSTSSL